MPGASAARDAGGRDAAESRDASSPLGMVIGAAGGTLSVPDQASLVIPPGALASDVAIGIEQTSVGAPPLPDGFSVFGPMFAFTPHGIRFAVGYDPDDERARHDASRIAQAGRSAPECRSNGVPIA